VIKKVQKVQKVQESAGKHKKGPVIHFLMLSNGPGLA
jgi:hypothetical protein